MAERLMRTEVFGRSTLYLADCRDVLQSFGNIDSLVTDPPYGMGFQSNYRGIKHAAIANDGDVEALRFACSIRASHSAYVFCRWDNLTEIPKPKSLLTWVKNNWSMGDLEHEHARQTETIAFYPGPAHHWPRERPTDVLECPRTGNDYHPTEKPVSLLWAIVRHTAGVVVDPFMGSGTTGIACEELDRDFVGIEIDALHFDTACRRMERAHNAPMLFA